MNKISRFCILSSDDPERGDGSGGQQRSFPHDMLEPDSFLARRAVRRSPYFQGYRALPRSKPMSFRPQLKGASLGHPTTTCPRLDHAPGPTPCLTPRERDVIHWLTEGKRDREIALILGLSPRTVEKHVCHILEKLGVETRTAAFAECRRSPALSEMVFNEPAPPHRPADPSFPSSGRMPQAASRAITRS